MYHKKFKKIQGASTKAARRSRASVAYGKLWVIFSPQWVNKNMDNTLFTTNQCCSFGGGESGASLATPEGPGG